MTRPLRTALRKVYLSNTDILYTGAYKLQSQANCEKNPRYNKKLLWNLTTIPPYSSFSSNRSCSQTNSSCCLTTANSGWRKAGSVVWNIIKILAKQQRKPSQANPKNNYYVFCYRIWSTTKRTGNHNSSARHQLIHMCYAKTLKLSIIA